jgi:hypothetical protein
MENSNTIQDFDFSDDEEQETPTYTEARQFVLRFGKYKHITLGEVTKNKEGRSYLKYLLSWDLLRDETRRPIEVCLREYKLARTV